MKRSVQTSFQTGPAPPKVQMIGLGLVAIVLSGASIWTALLAVDLERNGVQAVAQITALEGKANDVYPVFDFSDVQGRQHSVRAAFSFGDYAIGDTLAILYPADAPLKARVNTWVSLYFLPTIFGVMSVLFFAAAAVFFRFRPFFEAHSAKHRGKMVTETVRPDGSVIRTLRSSEPLLKGVGVAFGLASLVFFSAALWACWHSIEMARLGAETPGTVTKLVRTGNSHRLWFEFTDSDGASHTQEATQSSNDYLVGDAVQIRYFPTDPRSARIDRPAMYLMLPAYFGGLGSLCILITIVVRHQRRLICDA